MTDSIIVVQQPASSRTRCPKKTSPWPSVPANLSAKHTHISRTRVRLARSHSHNTFDSIRRLFGVGLRTHGTTSDTVLIPVSRGPCLSSTCLDPARPSPALLGHEFRFIVHWVRAKFFSTDTALPGWSFHHTSGDRAVYMLLSCPGT